MMTKCFNTIMTRKQNSYWTPPIFFFEKKIETKTSYNSFRLHCKTQEELCRWTTTSKTRTTAQKFENSSRDCIQRSRNRSDGAPLYRILDVNFLRWVIASISSHTARKRQHSVNVIDMSVTTKTRSSIVGSTHELWSSLWRILLYSSSSSILVLSFWNILQDKWNFKYFREKVLTIRNQSR